jgi:hypothetical protein
MKIEQKIIDEIKLFAKSWIKIPGLVSRRHPTVDEIAVKFGISESKIYSLRYTTCSQKHKIIPLTIPFAEHVNDYKKHIRKENRKRYVKEYLKSRKNIPLFCLRTKVQRFQKKSFCCQPFKAEDVVAKFGLNPICYLTGLPINYNEGSTYHLDHFVPLVLGGTSDIENLRLCNPKANEMKKGYLFQEYLKICRLVARQFPE